MKEAYKERRAAKHTEQKKAEANWRPASEIPIANADEQERFVAEDIRQTLTSGWDAVAYHFVNLQEYLGGQAHFTFLPKHAVGQAAVVAAAHRRRFPLIRYYVTLHARQAPKVRLEIMRRSPSWGTDVCVIAERALGLGHNLELPEEILAKLPKLAEFGIRAVFAKLEAGIFGFASAEITAPYHEEIQKEAPPPATAIHEDNQKEAATITSAPKTELRSTAASIVCAAYLESVKQGNQSYVVTVEAENPVFGGPYLVFFYPIGIGNDWPHEDAVLEVLRSAEEQHRRFNGPPIVGRPKVMHVTEEVYNEFRALLPEA